MSEIIARPENEYSNKYGFYALPKAPGGKFREDQLGEDRENAFQEIPGEE
jgi:hypothetical protein